MKIKEKDPNRFYVYRWIRLDSNTPFHVGKGSGNRAFDIRQRNEYFKRIKNKVMCECEIFVYDLSEEDSLKKEMEFIKIYKDLGYCETNFNEGGTGNKGYKHTEEEIEKMKKIANRPENIAAARARMTGKKCSIEVRKNMKEAQSQPEVKKSKSKAMLGRKMSETTYKNMVDRSNTPEERKRRSDRRLGFVFSDLTKEKMSKARKGRKNSQESIEKTRQSNLGRKRSPESCLNISRGLIGKNVTKVTITNKISGIVQIYASINEFIKHFKISRSTFGAYRHDNTKPLKNSNLGNLLEEWIILI